MNMLSLLLLLAGAAFAGDADDLQRAEQLDAQAMTLQEQGEYAAAESATAEELEIRIRVQGLDHPEVAATRALQAYLMHMQGRYEDASAAYKQATDELTAAFGPNHERVASVLGNHAALMMMNAEFERAETQLERALAILERKFGQDQLETVSVLSKMAVSAMNRGDYPTALARFTKAVEIVETHEGPESENLPHMLANLGAVHSVTGDLKQASELLKRAMEIDIVKLGPEHPEMAYYYVNLATQYMRLGDHAAAKPHLDKSLAIREASLGSEHPDVAFSLGQLGAYHMAVGEFESARRLQGRVLAILETTLGPNHPDVSDALFDLATTNQELGNFHRSRQLRERGLQIATEAFGPEHPRVADAMGYLAADLELGGEYGRARELLVQALDIVERKVGPDSLPVVVHTTTLANLLVSLGDLDAARPLYERALAINEEALGPDHPEVADALTNLASVAWSQRDWEAARTLLERALAIDQATYGHDNPEVAQTLANLAAMLHMQGDVAASRAMQLRALEIYETTFGREHPNVAGVLNNLATLHATEEDWPAARKLLERSIAMYGRFLLPDDPTLMTKYLSLGRAYRKGGDAERARPHVARALELGEHQHAVVDVLSEREALLFMRNSQPVLHEYLNTFDLPEETEQAWSALLRWKGLVSRRVRQRNAAAQSNSPEIRELAEALRRTKHNLTRLTYSDFDPNFLEDRERLLRDLTAERDKLERQLAQTSEAHRIEDRARDATPSALCAALPAKTALVDFIAIGAGEKRRYIAYGTSNPGCELHRFDLGSADAIEKAIDAWRAVISQPDQTSTRVYKRGAAVTERVWKPLAPVLDGVDRVIVVPDGDLGGLPFAALPVDDAYLVEQFTLNVLSDARDLLREDQLTGSGLMTAGEIDFGTTPAEGAEPDSGQRAASCVGRGFSPLAATGAEAAYVARAWKRSPHRKESVAALAGADATEAAISEHMVGKRVVHLATHGFYATGRCKSALAGQRGHSSAAFVGYNPMLLAGLVAAEANAIPAGAGYDGILTAEEIGSLDLRGLELAVLSACETGLGETRSGEGVLGLQRGFSIAGVDSVVMSLWSVQDKATADLMRAFYDHLFHRRRPLPPADALRAAQLQMLERARKSYGESSANRWAAFVVSGRP